MADGPVYIFLRKWVDQVINKDELLDIPIIKSHQNSPPPEQEDPYIIIKYAPNRGKTGRAYSGATNDEGKKTNANDYAYVIEIWEANGTGALLESLTSSVDKQHIKDLWSEYNYAYLSQGIIQTIPRLQGKDWKDDVMVEITIGVSRASIEKTGYIEDMEITGTIPAQGRTGDHTIEVENE